MKYEPKEFEPDGGLSKYYRTKKRKSLLMQALFFGVIYSLTLFYIFYV